MGKKNKEKDVDQVPNPNNASNRDIIQRLNFLYQASVYLNGVGAPRPSTPAAPGDANTEQMATESGKQGKHKRKRHRKEVINTSDLSRSYIRTMKIVGKKTTVKMDPSVKRTLCKGCNIVLIPGSTATVRVKSFPSHGHAVTYTCTSCKTCRRIPAPPTLLSEHVDVPVPITGPSTSPSESQPAQRHKPESIPADLHPPSETLDSRQNQTRLMKKKKPPPTPRLPPFFARDVGHVVFRGNERLPGS